MGIMIVLLLGICLVIVLACSRTAWQRRACPACGSYNPAGIRRCAYCTTWQTAREEQD